MRRRVDGSCVRGDGRSQQQADRDQNDQLASR